MSVSLWFAQIASDDTIHTIPGLLVECIFIMSALLFRIQLLLHYKAFAWILRFWFVLFTDFLLEAILKAIVSASKRDVAHANFTLVMSEHRGCPMATHLRHGSTRAHAAQLWWATGFASLASRCLQEFLRVGRLCCFLLFLFLVCLEDATSPANWSGMHFTTVIKSDFHPITLLLVISVLGRAVYILVEEIVWLLHEILSVNRWLAQFIH